MREDQTTSVALDPLTQSHKTTGWMSQTIMTITQKRIVVGVALFALLLWFFILPGLARLASGGSTYTARGIYPESIQDLDTIHRERVASMQRVCRQLVAQNRSTTRLPDIKKIQYNIFVNEKYQFIYCSVPKIACTNWKRLLLSLAGLGQPEDIQTSDIYNSKGKYYKALQDMQLNTYQPAEALKRIRNYKKFIFVREPYERLLSAWRNKFTQLSNYEMHERYGRRIIQQFREEASQVSLDGGHDVTFEEFLRFILDPQTTADGLQNEHWDSYDHLCYPCAFEYDYIGKYESMSEDIDYILSKMNITHLKMPDRGLYYHTMKTSDFILAAFKEVSEKSIKQIWGSYYNDFTIFGYPYMSFRDGDEVLSKR